MKALTANMVSGKKKQMGGSGLVKSNKARHGSTRL